MGLVEGSTTSQKKIYFLPLFFGIQPHPPQVPLEASIGEATSMLYFNTIA